MILRSKAHWGYDAAFMQACVAVLRITPAHFQHPCAVLGEAPAYRGFVQVSVEGDAAQLEKLFVDPAAIGTGAGRALFDWAADVARAQGAVTLGIDSDPGAAPFYERMGARVVGTTPSEAIPGRFLPHLLLTL